MNCHTFQKLVSTNEYAWVQATQRYAEESTSAAEQIAALQQRLSAEQDAKECERREREQAEQQVAELKVGASVNTRKW